jgi:hypothetical protein
MKTLIRIGKIVERGLLGSGGYYRTDTFGPTYSRRYVPLSQIVWC